MVCSPKSINRLGAFCIFVSLKTIANGFKIGLGLFWIFNGLYAKLLMGIPRHQQIIAIFFPHHAQEFNVVIGILEVLLGIWIFLRKWERATAILQILAILAMNTMEFIWAKPLLLWGPFNLLWALLLCAMIAFAYFNTQMQNEHR